MFLKLRRYVTRTFVMRIHSEKTCFKLAKNILSLIMQKQLSLIYRKKSIYLQDVFILMEMNFSIFCSPAIMTFLKGLNVTTLF